MVRHIMAHRITLVEMQRGDYKCGSERLEAGELVIPVDAGQDGAFCIHVAADNCGIPEPIVSMLVGGVAMAIAGAATVQGDEGKPTDSSSDVLSVSSIAPAAIGSSINSRHHYIHYHGPLAGGGGCSAGLHDGGCGGHGDDQYCGQYMPGMYACKHAF